MVTHIGSVIRYKKVPGSNPVWVGCGGLDIYMYQWLGGVKNCLWLRVPPGSGILSVADMSITGTKGDVKV